MALDVQPGASAERVVAADPIGGDQRDAHRDGYGRAFRVAVLLIGDHDIAAELLDEALASLRPPRRSDALRSGRSVELLRALVLRAQEADERLTHGEPTGPPLLARSAHDTDDPLAATNRRDVRWALLGLPMSERAALVLHAQARLAPAAVERCLSLPAGGAIAHVHEARLHLQDGLGVAATDAQVDHAVERAASDIAVTVDDGALAHALIRRRGIRHRVGRRQRVAVVATAALLAAALVWLTTRDVNRPLPVIRGPVTTAARPTPSTDPAVTPLAAAVGAAVTTSAPTTVVATTGAPTTTVSPAPAEVAAADDTTITDVADAVPGDDTVEPAVEESVDDTVADAVAATAARQVRTTTRPSPPTTTAAPATTATTAAPVPVRQRLTITSASCTRTLLGTLLTLNGVTDRSTTAVSVATPWGSFATTARTRTGSNVASWSLSTAVRVARGSGPATVTATSGSQRASTSVTCG